MSDENGHLGVSQDRARHRRAEQALEPASVVRADDDDVGVVLLGGSEVWFPVFPSLSALPVPPAPNVRELVGHEWTRPARRTLRQRAARYPIGPDRRGRQWEPIPPEEPSEVSPGHSVRYVYKAGEEGSIFPLEIRLPHEEWTIVSAGNGEGLIVQLPSPPRDIPLAVGGDPFEHAGSKSASTRTPPQMT